MERDNNNMNEGIPKRKPGGKTGHEILLARSLCVSPSLVLSEQKSVPKKQLRKERFASKLLLARDEYGIHGMEVFKRILAKLICWRRSSKL